MQHANHMVAYYARKARKQQVRVNRITNSFSVISKASQIYLDLAVAYMKECE